METPLSTMIPPVGAAYSTADRFWVPIGVLVDLKFAGVVTLYAMMQPVVVLLVQPLGVPAKTLTKIRSSAALVPPASS